MNWFRIDCFSPNTQKNRARHTNWVKYEGRGSCLLIVGTLHRDSSAFICGAQVGHHVIGDLAAFSLIFDESEEGASSDVFQRSGKLENHRAKLEGVENRTT